MSEGQSLYNEPMDEFIKFKYKVKVQFYQYNLFENKLYS